MLNKDRKLKSLESYMGSALLLAFVAGGVLGMLFASDGDCFEDPSKVEISSPQD